MKILLACFICFHAICDAKRLPPKIYHPEFPPWEMPDSDPVWFLMTFPQQVSHDVGNFSFDLVLFESDKYQLPQVFNATMKSGSDIVLTQSFSQNQYGLQRHKFEGNHHLNVENLRLEIQMEQDRNRHFSISNDPQDHVFIQTDKAKYKPSQLVQFRILGLDSKAMPVSEYLSFSIDIHDAKSNLIQQWPNVSLNFGLFAGSLKLSDFVNFGDWRIEVKNLQSKKKFTKNFNVENYVLPKFEANIDFSDGYMVLKSNVTNRLRGSITAKYTFGKPVQGKVKLSVSEITCRPNRKIIAGEDLVMELSLSGNGDDGKFEFGNLNAYLEEELQVMSSLSSNPKCSLTVDYEVVEEMTLESRKGSQKVDIYKNALALKIHESTAGEKMRPGLPFNIRIQVTKPNGSPVIGEKLNIVTSVRSFNDVRTCRSAPEISSDGIGETSSEINNFGIVTTSFLVPNSSKSLVLDAFVRELPSTTFCYDEKVDKSESKDSLSLEINHPSEVEPPKVGDTVEVKVRSTFAAKLIYVMLVNNGKTLEYKTLGQPANNRGTLFTTKIQLPQESSPESSILAWSVGDEGKKVVVASGSFAVDGFFRQQIEAEFSGNQVRPGSAVALKITTSDPNSTVALFAVDKSVKLLQGGNDITSGQVLEALTSSGRNGAISMRGIGFYPCYFGYDKIDKYFNKIGLNVFSNSELRPVYRQPVFKQQMREENFMKATFHKQPMALLDEINDDEGDLVMTNVQTSPAVRSEFPETWFWFDFNSGTSESHHQLQVPDTITSWVVNAMAVGSKQGFGTLKKPVELTVFQPFFVSLHIPYATVIRGERVLIKALVYSYQPRRQEVSLRLKRSDSYMVSRVDTENLYQSMNIDVKLNVEANGASSFDIWIKPLMLGEIQFELEGRSNEDADTIRKTLVVEAEGEIKYSNKPMLIQRESDEEPQTHVVIDPQMLFERADGHQIVRGSKFFQLQVVGDVLGPALSHLGSQVRLPTGCGEQTMIIMAPNIYIYKYLTAVGEMTPELRVKTKEFTESGYQRELTYRRSDNGFSAFGDKDPNSSTWLTAFVVRCFAAAKKHIGTTIDDDILKQSWQFIASKAKNDGFFADEGRVIHRDMMGRGDSEANLAAYIYAAYAEAGGMVGGYKISWKSLVSTKSLLGQVSENTTNYRLALVTYATSILSEDRSLSENTADLLLSKANHDGGLIYWETLSGNNQVETAAYALLAFCNLNRITEAANVAKWLMTQRNSLGGFSSTQDTVVGLQSLAEFAQRFSSTSNNLNIKAIVLFADNLGPIVHNFRVQKLNALVLQSFDLPRGRQSLARVDLEVTGEGKAMFQLAVKYNVEPMEVRDSGDFDIFIEPMSVRRRRSASNSTSGADIAEIRACLNPKTSEVKTGMTVMEIGVPTGFEVDLDLHQKMNPVSRNVPLKRIELANGKLIFYFDQTTDLTCILSKMLRVNPASNIQPPVAQVYSYYEPMKQKSINYKISAMDDLPTVSPPSITATTPITTTKSIPPPTTTPTTKRDRSLGDKILSFFRNLFSRE